MDNPTSTPAGGGPKPAGDAGEQTTANAPEASSRSYARDVGIESSPKMEAAEQEVRKQFANAGDNQAPAEETIESLRAELQRLTDRRAPKAEMHLKIDDSGIQQESDEQADQEDLARMQEIRGRIAEKEKDQRRQAYMLQFQMPDPDQGPDADEDPDPELVE